MSRKFSLLFVLILIPLISGCATALIGGGIAVGASIAHDRRTMGSIMEDQSIEFKAFDLIANDPQRHKNSRVSITSYNQVVLLTGQVDSDAYRQHAVQLIQGIDKVKRVVDQLELGTEVTMSEYARDSTITSEAKTKLVNLGLPGFDATRVKIVTERGTVYLMGIVSQQEADAAAEKIRTIKGVNKVVKVFEYI